MKVRRPSKSKAKAEMKRAEIFERVRIGIDAVVETDRTDRQFVTQPRADGVAHVVHANIFRAWEKIARIGENRHLQFTENWERVFDIEHGIEFSTDGMAMIIVRP